MLCGKDRMEFGEMMLKYKRYPKCTKEVLKSMHIKYNQ